MSTMLTRQIDTHTLEALCTAGVIREVIITRVPQASGDTKWGIQVKYGINTQWLRSKRQPRRLFHTIDTAANLIRDCGITHVQLDLG